MKDLIHFAAAGRATPARDAASTSAPLPDRGSARPGSASPLCIPEQARLKELETENSRLLSLIGELLVTNQQLRERIAR